MRFKSLNLAVQDARTVLRRFHAAVMASVVGTLAMVVWINCERHYRGDADPLWKAAMVASLGITLFLSLKVFCEVKRFEPQRSRWFYLAGLAFLAVYFVTFLGKPKGADFYRFFLISADLHLLVAIAPFLFEPNLSNAFWQYNKSLFIRIGIAAVYSATIYLGGVIALVCLDKLFDLHIKEQIYLQLWFMVVGVFNTWFFLGGVPERITALETDDSYPNGLRIFTQFILIPLVVLYYVILYLYMGKIIVTWNLPVGWLSSFIIGASLLGILTLLLVYPLRGRSEFGWIRTYAKYFYLALLPLVVLMAVAIFRRISDYGITVERYFVLLFTVWLFFISVKFTRRPETDIRLVPTSMCILILAAIFGPLSALNVSARSQLGRLEYYLTKTGHLTGGVLQKGKRQVSFKDGAEISSIVDYLYRMHGLHLLNRWARKGEDFKTADQYSFCRDYLGIEYIERYQRDFGDGPSDKYYFYYNAQPEMLTNIQGFDYLYLMQGFYRAHQDRIDSVQTPRGNFDLKFMAAGNSLDVQYAGQTLSFDLDPLLASFKETKGRNGYNIPSAQMTLQQENDLVLIRLNVVSMNGNYVGEVPTIDSLTGQVLMKFKGTRDGN